MVKCINKATGKVYIHTEKEVEVMKYHPQTKGKFHYEVIKEDKPAVAKKASPKK